MKIEYKNVGDLLAYQGNSRTHSDDQIDQIVQSLKSFGFNNPILIDENNTIIAGHARLLAAEKADYKEVPTITLSHLTDAQKKAYVIADNKLALNAGWDFDFLLSEFEAISSAGLDVGLTGFTPDEIAAFTPDLANEGLTDGDAIPEHVEAITQSGDIWLLGKHRLMCGDSTDQASVDWLCAGEKLDMVFTDPPYNTGMTSQSQKGSGGLWKGSGSARLSHMFDDSYTDEEWHLFLSSIIKMLFNIMKEDSVIYICLNWRRNHELVRYLDEYFHRSNLIVWDKVVHGLGSDYKYTHEFINVCKKGKPKLNTHQGDREYSDMWHIQRKVGKNEDHATAKPVELIERSIRHSTNINMVVGDLFGGSGTTLIACEKLNRKCFMMEISPNYCDIIIKRWEEFTGKKANLQKPEVANG